MNAIRIPLAALALVACARAPAEHSSRGADSAEIIKFIDAHAVTWNRHDARSVAELWHPDGDIRDDSVISGRAAIEQRYAEMFAGRYKATTHSHPGGYTIRFLTPDVAILDGFAQVTGLLGPDGRELPPSGGPYTAVLTKVNGRWGIAALR